MNDQQLFQLTYHDLWPFYVSLVGASPGARLLELEGVQAAITPAVPNRSILNGVVYESADALAANMDLLASTYEQAGVTAWMVWVPSHDGGTAKLLEQAGHKLDAAPAAMARELAPWQPGDVSGFEIEQTDEIGAICALNDHAYGYTEPAFAKAITGVPDGFRMYVIRDEGKVMSCVASQDVAADDCAIWMVATHADARGRGFAGALMTKALSDACERQRRTTSLQATKLGYPVYRRLGYKDLGSIQMWERRSN